MICKIKIKTTEHVLRVKKYNQKVCVKFLKNESALEILHFFLFVQKYWGLSFAAFG